MSVYVDPLMRTLPNKIWPYPAACHMIADSLEELHAIADKIGLKRAWFQNRSVLAHYDLTANKRKAAIRHGAIEISFQHLAEMAKTKRKGGS